MSGTDIVYGATNGRRSGRAGRTDAIRIHDKKLQSRRLENGERDPLKCIPAICLRAPYGMSGTDIAPARDGAIGLRARCALSGIDGAYLPTRVLRDVRY
eukprot:3439565-Rhodomonas_salina.2